MIYEKMIYHDDDMMTIQAKVPLLLESLQSDNTEDALFPHICRLKVYTLSSSVSASSSLSQ